MFTFVLFSRNDSLSRACAFGDEQIRREVPVRSKQINPTSASVMADVYLGVAVTGLYTLVGMGLIIVFM